MAKVYNNQDLKIYNTFGISVFSKKFATFSSIEQLKLLLDENRDEQILILGGGSNLLFTTDFNGLILKNEIKGFNIVKEKAEDVIVRAGAGEIWHEFVMWCINNDYSGLENLSLIPGSVGASPIQNIGAYGVEIKDVFHSLEALHISSGEIHTFNLEQCKFGYRESVFKGKYRGQYVITSVSFHLSKRAKINAAYGAIQNELEKIGINSPNIKDISNAVIAIRRSKLPDPQQLGNAGSFFKNPIVNSEILQKIKTDYRDVPFFELGNDLFKIPAGWLIERAGWKGKTIGNCGVHKLQALVLVNYGGATGNEVIELSEKIIQDIENKFGITLEREVNIVK